MKFPIVIAEAGVNHNGSLDLAYRLIDAAVSAQADIVKFQSFKAANLASKRAPKAQYQANLTDSSESQFEMLKRLELPQTAHFELRDYCRAKKIEFLSTPFDQESLRFLCDEVGILRIKIPSGEITNAPFILAAARYGLPMILSTGMSTLEEVKTALGVVAFGFLEKSAPPSAAAFNEAYLSSEGQRLLKEKATVLHCVTEYPAPFEDINLRAMQTLRAELGLEVGYSDHTLGISIPMAATALGAQVIEKHFTMDRTLPGPDHKASLEPDELSAMIGGIREVALSLGDGIKAPKPSEIKNMAIARKSLVAKRSIRAGEAFSEDNLTTKRPGNGISPMKYWEYIGMIAQKDYQEDEVIS